MHDPLDRLEVAVGDLAQQTSWEQQNRLGLLWVHAFTAFWAGWQMLVWGSATNIEATVGVWSRPFMGLLGIVGGGVLAWGLTRTPRSIPFEVVGLVLIGTWDAAMTAGLLYARIDQGEFGLRHWGEPLPTGYVAAYPVTVYFGLFALICVHLWTLRRMKRGK